MISAVNIDQKWETERINALRKYNILDTPPDGSFDHIVHLAAAILKVPIALVTLVDSDRIWFKSSVGLHVKQINRDPGLCDSAILSDDLYIVEDARSDARTLANPLVAGDFGLQFYAAMPLKVRGGYKLGTLCIIDREPRTLTREQKLTLERLAEILVDQLELRLEARMAMTRQQQMLHMVAHELKSPLSIITAYSQLIKGEAANHDMIITMCNQIGKANSRMNDLINEVLDTAKLHAEEIQLKKTVFDIATVVDHVFTVNVVLANAKQQKINLDIAENMLVEADEGKIVEILNNLINNAIKYSPPDSAITIKLKAGEQSAIFEICDEGPGLTEQDFDQLFMPFTRLSARPTGGESSTGIGLFIVKTLVEAQGGKVSANNIENAGACFKIEIPTIKEN